MKELATSRTKLVYVNQPLSSLTPDVMVKSAWVSTAIALILTLPALVLFVTLFQETANLALAAGVGFGVHFALLALSGRVSSSLSKLFED